MAYEIIYASAAAQPLSPQDLAEILRVAREKNAARNITGVLLHERGSFLQVLEGDEAAVTEVFAHIAKDPRHKDVTLLRKGPIDGPSFSQWSMGMVEMTPEVRVLPGVNDFFRAGLAALGSEKAAAGRVLTGFRDGRYHKFIK